MTKSWFKFYDSIPETIQCPEFSIYDALAKTAKAYPVLYAVEYMGAKLTFSELLRCIDTAAASLTKYGIHAGDSITIAMPNTPNAVILFYAISKIGATAAMVHPLSPPNELEHYLNATNSKMAVTVDMFAEKFLTILGNTSAKQLLITGIGDFLPRVKSFLYNLTNHVDLPADDRIILWKDFFDSKLPVSPAITHSCHTPAVVLFSGGTTDTPKGILLSDYAFNALAVSMRDTAHYAPGDSTMTILPIFHGFGLGLCVHTTLFCGGMSILIPKFSADNYIKALIKYKPQFVAGVPTLFEALLRHPNFRSVRFDKLKGAYSGGDTLSFEIKQRFDAALRSQGSKVDLLEGYGTTECVTSCALTPTSHYRKDSVGVPMPNVDMCIVKEDSTEVLPFGVEGEICVAGPQLMLGYLNDPAETGRTLRIHDDGKLWMHTGDAGYMDEDGFIFFKSRIKRIIKVSGMNVYPAQVERILEEYPLVQRACVIGVPDDYQMMSIKAFVVLTDKSGGSQEIIDTLREHCSERLIKWSVPRSIEFKSELPTTLVGKIAYNKLEQNTDAIAENG